MVRNKAVCATLEMLPDDPCDVLGIRIEQTEGAKLCVNVFNELRSRSVNDIVIAVVDGLKRIRDAIEAAFPKTADLSIPPPNATSLKHLTTPTAAKRVENYAGRKLPLDCHDGIYARP